MNKTTPLPLSHQTFLALYCDAAKALPLLEGENNFAQLSGPAWMQELAEERYNLVANFLLSSIYEYAERPELLLRVQDVVLETLADGENEDDLSEPEEPTPPPPPQDLKSQKKVKPKSRPRKSYYKPVRFRRRLMVQQQDTGALVGTIKSLTKDDGTRWHPEINRHGILVCDCPDFRYRHGGSYNGRCKHLRKVLSAAKRRQLL